MKQWTITWHKASEELPPKSDRYLVAQLSEYDDERVIGLTDLYYSARHKAFNAFDRDPPECAKKHAIGAAHICWAEYPKKLEKNNEVTE